MMFFFSKRFPFHKILAKVLFSSWKRHQNTNAWGTVARKGHLDMSIFFLLPKYNCQFSLGLSNTRSRLTTRDLDLVTQDLDFLTRDLDL